MYERNSYAWVDLLPEALFSYRITVGVTKKTPFEIFYFRKPHFVYSCPGSNLSDEENDLEEFNEGDREKVQEIHSLLMQDVREQREQNAAKMKKRWDTVNAQQVEVLFYSSLFLCGSTHFEDWKFCSCRPQTPLQSTSQTSTWLPSLFRTW